MLAQDASMAQNVAETVTAKDSRLPSTVSTEKSSAPVKPSDLSINADDAFSIKKVSSIRFSFQIFLTTLVLALCFYGINFDKDKANNTAFWGGITGLVAWWMPSPGSSSGVSKSDAK